MASRNRNFRAGKGFSLFDLTDTITDVTDTLANALSKQGVEVNHDDLLLQIQSVVRGVGQPTPMYSGVPFTASDDPVAPYSIAGDLIASAYENFNAGRKKTAISQMLEAMAFPDFNDIVMGLTLMNSQHSPNEIRASIENELKDDEDEDENGDEEDEDLEEGSDDTELDEDDENDDDLLEDEDDDEDDYKKNKSLANDDDKDGPKPESDEEDEGEEEEKPEPNKNKLPMQGTSSQLEAADANVRAISNKLSLTGDPNSRSKAKAFLKEVRSSRS